MAKPTVAVYNAKYLPVSCTFIYRQLQSVREVFDPVFLTREVDNVDIFPFNNIKVLKENLLSKWLGKLKRNLRMFRVPYGMDFYSLQRYKSVVIEKKIQLIHAHFGYNGMFMLPLAKRLNLPLLVTFHGNDASRLLKQKKYVKGLHDLFSYAHVIVVSEYMRERLLDYGLLPSKSSMIRCGIPLDLYAYHHRKPIASKMRDGDLIECLQLSNFVEKKGHRYTLEAFSRVLSCHKNLRLVLAGDGPLRKEMEQLCGQLDISSSVQFVGRIPFHEGSRLMQKADIFLHHSVTAKDGDCEGIPTVIMEAMASGLTVISSRHAGIPEIINHGGTGYLAGERDIKEYSHIWKAALHSEQPVGQRARKFVDRHLNGDIQGSLISDLYMDLCGHRFQC